MFTFIGFSYAQLPYHLYNHTFPNITSQDPKVVEMLNQITDNQIIECGLYQNSFILLFPYYNPPPLTRLFCRLRGKNK